MNEPKLRFKEFKDEWKEVKLGDISQKITKGTSPKTKDGNVNFIKVESIKPNNELVIKGHISEKEHNGALRRSKLEKNDILFSIAGTLGRTTIVKSDILPANINQALAIIRLNENNNNKFIETLLGGKTIKEYVARNPTIGAQPNLSLKQLSDIKIFIPSLEEQQRIADFFADLNSQIELQSDKLKILEKDKKGYLQKMFPSDDSNKPKLRLKGFRDDWETKELKDVVNVTMGQSPDSKNYTDKKDYSVLIQGNADLKNGYVSPRIYTKQVTRQVNRGDTILTVRAPVGEVAINNFDGAVIGRGVAGISKNEFIFYYLQWMNLSKSWDRLSTGSTFDSINSNDIKNLRIKLPTNINEQVQISMLLSNLDKQIELQKQKVTDLKNQKKAYLHKMFI